MVYALIKVFDKEEHAKEFQSGILFSRQLRVYRAIEDKETDNRNDENEGLVAQYNLINEKIIIGKGLEAFELKYEDIVKPVKVYQNKYDFSFIFCMYAIHSKDWKRIEKKKLEEFYSDMAIRKEIEKLGDYAVIITNVTKFIDRVKKMAEKANIDMQGNLVKYKDLSNHNGKISDDQVGFVKDIRFKHQNEYRFKFEFQDNSEFKKINIVDISDISILMKAKEINQRITFNFG
ncbi:hypothetical protein [Alkaliphilus metalliredigens]|nr:hypothetical protein [Alkaliphilus metalliredigens]